MKSFSKRVASFTMAAAMVLSLAAVSPVDAQAAKKASITKKTSITAGKTYTYKIKNVTSKQYVKVTGITSGVKVKYNNKTVKKNSTKIKGGKTIALKVKASDKVANYKATVKAQVYNKSNNKKVGSLLKTTSTVKCTKLEVTSVTVASTSGKYLIATFNRQLDKLSAADVEIRDKETNELKGVEKVELASDGKSVNITLVGDELANRQNRFIEPNVDYTFTVAQKSVKATTNFKVDAVVANASVVAVDKVNRKITVDNPTSWTGSARDFTIPTTVAVDFDKLIGSTVTVQYDKNNVVTKLVSAKETVVESAFEVVTGNNASSTYLKDLSTNTKYYLQVDSGDLYDTAEITIEDADYKYKNRNFYTYVSGNSTKYAYAKLTLNANGTVKTIVGDRSANFTNNMLVDKVTDNTISAGTKTVWNLKDYLVLEKGSSVAPADLVGKVVFYDASQKFAVAYTESKTGALEAVYDNKFKFNGTIYNTTLNRLDGTNGVKPADNDYMKSLLAGKEDITVYFDLAGKPAFVTGKTATVVTNEKTIILTKDAEFYNSALKDVLRLTGSDGKTAIVKDIDVANLTSIVDKNNAKFEKKTTVSSNNNGGAVTGFNAVNFNGGGATTTINAYVSENIAGGVSTNKPLVALTGSSDATKQKAIKITEDDKGNVIGIALKDSVGVVSGDFVSGKSSITLQGSGTGLQIKASVPVYFYNTSTDAVSSTTYGEYSAKANDGNATVYSSNGKDVDCVVVTQTVSAALKYVKAVVGNRILNTDSEIASLTTITGKETTTYEKFSDAVAKETTKLAIGKVVVLGIAADGKTVEEVKDDTASIGTVTANVVVSTNTVNQNDGTFKNLAGSATYTLAGAEKATVTVVITDKDANGDVYYKVADFSDLATISKTANKVDVYSMANTAYIDTIVITAK